MPSLNGYFYLIIGIAALAIVTFVGYKAYNIGYTSAQVAWQAKYDKYVIDQQKAANDAVQKQIIANNATVAEQNKIIEGLKTKNDGLQKLIDENDQEIQNDPTVNSCGISKSGAIRLNRIR